MGDLNHLNCNCFLSRCFRPVFRKCGHSFDLREKIRIQIWFGRKRCIRIMYMKNRWSGIFIWEKCGSGLDLWENANPGTGLDLWETCGSGLDLWEICGSDPDYILRKIWIRIISLRNCGSGDRIRSLRNMRNRIWSLRKWGSGLDIENMRICIIYLEKCWPGLDI